MVLILSIPFVIAGLFAVIICCTAREKGITASPLKPELCITQKIFSFHTFNKYLARLGIVLLGGGI
jgi:hypothetical protein